jgi:hypothetical protein
LWLAEGLIGKSEQSVAVNSSNLPVTLVAPPTIAVFYHIVDFLAYLGLVTGKIWIS